MFMNRSKICVVQKPSKNFRMTGEIKVNRLIMTFHLTSLSTANLDVKCYCH
jgi:hypothetical protein